MLTLHNYRDVQLKPLADEDEDEDSAAIINHRHSFYSHLAVAQEKLFSNRRKKLKKKSADAPVDTALEVRIIDVLD